MLYTCLRLAFTLLFVNMTMIFGGEEVLTGFHLSLDDLQPSDICIIQFDSRPLDNYWNASAIWNKAYAMYHGHKYAFMTMHSTSNEYKNQNHNNIKDKQYCYSKDNYKLHVVWCKVKAIISASRLIPSAKAYLYIDSDVVITSNYSLSHIIGYIRKDLNWDLRKKPVAFNQDGPGWSCKHAMSFGFNYCLNSGTVFWLKDDIAQNILEDWWLSASQPYSESKFKTKWRRRWPWEQAQMYKVYDTYSDHIMRLSFPNQSYLPWTSHKNPRSNYPTDSVDPWCFSHWPGANCFITHHCASLNQKMKIIENYAISYKVKINPIYID